MIRTPTASRPPDLKLLALSHGIDDDVSSRDFLFDPGARPCVRPEAASLEEVDETVHRCPSGAPGVPLARRGGIARDPLRHRDQAGLQLRSRRGGRAFSGRGCAGRP
ncbi:MAG: (4Fe-4S)-binding protein [Actinomycetota bacterium]